MRALYWPSQPRNIIAIRIMEAATSGGAYSLLQEIDALDAAKRPVTAYLVPDAYYYKAYSWDGAQAVDVTSGITSAIPSPDDGILRRARRLFGDLRDVVVTDTELREAYSDCISIVNDDLSTSIECVTVTDSATGRVLAVGVQDEDHLAVSDTILRAIALRGVIEIVTGELGSHARDAISMDSPAGRINTTASPDAVREFLMSIRAQYREVKESISGGSVGEPIIANLDDMMTARGYEVET